MAAEVKRGKAARDRWVKALYEAGAGLLVGTDTPNPFIVPGFSFHEELANLTEAGIPSDALLRMATVEAARFLGEEGEFGIVAAGARADLILVEGDPSRDLDVLRRPAYVMLNGHLRDRATLQNDLDALAARYAAETH
jgi:imidazolonepropionase-like amidohydrolase